MLFVYGTLQDGDILSAVLGRRLDVDALPAAVAPDFRAVAYPGRVYPALVSAPGQAAPGRLVDGLDASDLAVIDGFEGEEYRRGTLDVWLRGRLQRAETYFPVIEISSEGPVWALAEWTLRHKPAVISSETGTAAALRQRLTAPSRL